MTQQVDAVVSDEVVVDGETIKKKVDELSLDEIKAELEKRNLDFAGDDYAILHERLTDSMIEEGLDPATFEFELEADEDDDDEEDEAVVKTDGDQKPAEKSDVGAAKQEKKSEAVETANTASNKQEDKKAAKPPAQQSKQPDYKEIPGNHLWVSGLSSRCKAAELKKFFTRYASVGSAKIVANARTTSAHCYGYITVDKAADLQKCVEKLHCTRFEGNFIQVEICKLAPADQLRKVEIGNRQRIAQQKEEFRRIKVERKQKLDEENKKKAQLKKAEAASKKKGPQEASTKGEGRRPMPKGAKKEFNKDDRKPQQLQMNRKRSRSPFRRGGPPDMPRRGGGPRRFDRGGAIRRRSPFIRGRPRTRSPSPFGHGPPPPFVHGQPPMMDRPGPPRMIDRRLEEERFEAERRQRAEAEALERERRQLRLEKERLEREKLELIRIERERVKREMEEVAARKELAERRRQEDLHRQQQQQQQDEERKREQARLELDRRPRESSRVTLQAGVQDSLDIYDPRAPIADDYGRGQLDSKFSGRLGPPPQRDQALARHDDRRRDERRRESALSRDDRRAGSQLDPWGGQQDSKSRGGGNNYIEHGSMRNELSASKRARSRSPQRSSGGSGFGMSSQDYGRQSAAGADLWTLGVNTGSYMDNRRPQGRSIEVQQSNGNWPSSSSSSSSSRIAFPPAYNQQESNRGFLGNSSSSGGFGMASGAYRRY